MTFKFMGERRRLHRKPHVKGIQTCWSLSAVYGAANLGINTAASADSVDFMTGTLSPLSAKVKHISQT